MNQHNIVHLEAHRFVEFRRRILEAEPDIDERTLHDTLEGATDMREAISAAVRSAIEDRTMADALKVRISDLRERLTRIEKREEQKRAAARWAMEEAVIDKIIEADMTISLRTSPPAVKVIDEGAIPEWFWVPQPAKLDRRALLDALKGGTAVSGAELGNPRMCLSVRTK
ncbi:MAG: siphovirus Gp157 family protein [Rhizobiaceae bacterium]|nr:siphovirus Gp157 family protein [Rhizobiaceae bacterium]